LLLAACDYAIGDQRSVCDGRAIGVRWACDGRAISVRSACDRPVIRRTSVDASARSLPSDEIARIFTDASAQRSKLKHIDCRQEWIKILRDKPVCTPAHVPTKDNLADLFTKILPNGDFIRL